MKNTVRLPLSGIIPIYKPIGPTSHDMIYKVRKLTEVKRVGHAGTLDPLASGVLVIGISREYTKQLETFVQAEKEYEAEFTLGVTSSTDDEQGEKKVQPVATQPQRKEIETELHQFVGTIWQTPPAFSAVKLGGKKAYQQARKGISLTLFPRQREVKSIELLDYQWPLLKLRIVTGKGVYIRALARDLGEKLGTGAYMSALIRTRVGQFNLEDCIQIV